MSIRIALLLFLGTLAAFAVGQRPGETYKVNRPMKVYEGGTLKQADADSRFMVKAVNGAAVTIRFSTARGEVNTVDPYTLYINQPDSAGGWEYHLGSDFVKAGRFTTTTGVLAIPFKLQMTDWNVTSGSTIGAYVGLAPSSRVEFVGTAGLCAVPVSTTVATSAPETKWGLSAAVGVVWHATSTTQVGFFVGYDHLGGVSRATYKYNDSLWLSFGIGFRFAGGS